MSQCCVKICTPKEIEQIRNTIRTPSTIDIGRHHFEPAQNPTEGRRVGINNWKAGLSSKSQQMAIATNTNPIEVNTLPMRQNSQEAVSKENKDTRLANPSHPEVSTQAQGEVGEYQAKCLATEQLGINLIDYDQSHHGIDGIGKDKDGHFCILEYKFTEGRDGRSDLETYPIKNQNGNPILDENGQPRKMKQAGLDWVTDRLNNMQQDRHELYSERNAQLAKEVQIAMDRGDTVRRILIHTNTNTLNMTVNEDKGDDDWQFQIAYSCLDKS